MFPEIVTQIAVFALAALCMGGLAWVFVYPRLSGEAKAEKRIDRVAETRSNRRPNERSSGADPAAKRKQIEETLKELEEKQKRATTNAPLSVRIQQAGLTWSKRTFLTVSIVAGVVGFLVTLILSSNLLISGAVAFAAGFGFPRWFLGWKKNRRLTKFIMEFPNAVDVIVRGVKAGLPLNDCIRICAQEAEEPVRTEFRAIIETQALGIPLADAVEKLYERVPVSEANFFGIVVSVQQRSGGNLSEVLGNLSKVLRDRKKMKQKIIALSQEAKASAAIIGALPLVVMLLVWLTTPSYIETLWLHPTGQFLMMISAFWMTCGVLVMKKMINFDF